MQNEYPIDSFEVCYDVAKLLYYRGVAIQLSLRGPNGKPVFPLVLHRDGTTSLPFLPLVERYSALEGVHPAVVVFKIEARGEKPYEV